MPLTLKNYTKQLPKELIQLAEKNEVRECDETEKGHFIAYVDEGSNSYDVSLMVLPNGEIGKSACDCKNINSFCRHKTALLLHIAKDKKIKDPVKLKKKEGKAETLLGEVEFSGLKDWVKNLIEKNKDIELAFIHHFSAKSQQYTPEEVVKLIRDAIKATGINKKTIDATQLKKLVELWSEVLRPVVEHYRSNVMDEQAFLSFHPMIELCLQFQWGINSSSNKIVKYIADILQQSEAAINDLMNDEAWDKATGFFINNIPDGANGIRMHYLLHLQNILSASSTERKERLIGLLAGQFKKSDPERTVGGNLYSKTIFGIVEANNLLPKYYLLFKPLRFDNEFNENLISFLIENNHLKLAERFCEEQIKGNYREEYNVPYLKLLKEIYTSEKNETKLAGVLTQLFPYSFDFDDYLFIADRMQPEEKKKWRTKILARARNASRNYNKPAMEFCFKLMDHEKSYKKMIDYVDSYTTYPLILKYFEPMLSADKKKLLNAIVRKSDDDWRSNTAGREKDQLCFPELFEIAKKHYTADFLRLVLKQEEKSNYYYNRLNRFLTYMKAQLSN